MRNAPSLALNDIDSDAVYLKRPHLNFYSDYRKQGIVELLPQMLLDEVQPLEVVSQNPHPNIIKYHGCRVRRGRIKGLVLDKHPHDLKVYLRDAIGTNDKEPFMDALESAVRHLHSLGLAHNDINPGNILVNKARLPVLVDFGSCREVGRTLGASRGTTGWIQGESSDYNTSETQHDWFAVEKIRAWLDGPH
ncbi:kinase-like protein [Parathielavia hyrcaniae]|uniref:Kinase-like protein n=1 Tax=Parathielavia hyrcaniae TaxID=113614 RepID=A0AAN6SWY7_9PEZI|nr:kinase-like protein [Parathielavia hyrcaniae]